MQTINVTSIEAELMAICIGPISAMENNNTQNIIVLTNSISAVSKVLEFHVNSLQNSVIPLTSRIKTFLEKDRRNAIHFWYCSSKAEWPRHKLVNDQVKAAIDAPTLPSRNSFLFSKKKEYDDILKEWQTTFLTSCKRGQLFLDFKDEKECVIKPIYAKKESWLPFIGFTNSLCA